MALYFYTRRRGGACAATDAEVQPVVRFREQDQAPNTWIESLYYFAEAIRSVGPCKKTRGEKCLQL